MSKYRINHAGSTKVGSGWSSWEDRRDCSCDEGAIFAPEGLVTALRHYHESDDCAIVNAIVSGRYYYAYIAPCPTRIGLMRMARRLQKQWIAEAHQ